MGNVEFNMIVPTGSIIKEYLDESGISQKELSFRTGISEKHISNVFSGKSRLTEEFALKLEKIITKVPASYWLNYEAKYRESLARKEELLSTKKWDLDSLAKRFKFNEIFGDLDLCIEEQAIEMLKLLKLSDFCHFEAVYGKLQAEFLAKEGEKEAIAIWLNLCESEIELQNDEIGMYDAYTLQNMMDKFSKDILESEEDIIINQCRKFCNTNGIYLVVCDGITGSNVQGALVTYKGNPAIYLRTGDKLKYAFFHELGHLLLHYNKKEISISFDGYEEMTDKEKEADNFAMQMLNIRE